MPSKKRKAMSVDLNVQKPSSKFCIIDFRSFIKIIIKRIQAGRYV